MTAFESLGFAFREQSESDYGIDAHAELIRSGQPTGRLLGIQLKSGPSYLAESATDGYIFRADKEHVWYSQDGRATWDADGRLRQSLQQLSHAREGLGHLEYELSKVRPPINLYRGPGRAPTLESPYRLPP